MDNLRINLNNIDQSKPINDWKNLLADRGRRRHLSYTLDFDSRVHAFDPPSETWAEEAMLNHFSNQERVKREIAHEFGIRNIEGKIRDFIAIKSKPFPIISHHNAFFEQIRKSFIIGAYYPALVSSCTLGERILNHLIIELRDYYKGRPEYKFIYRKSSFDRWEIPIDTLEAWEILRPKAVLEFRQLQNIRNRSIHFNPSTYTTLYDDALKAILHVRNIIDEQFTAFGDRPWFIPGTKGHLFIKKEWEKNPFIQKFYIPNCPFVGPYFAISLNNGLNYHDLNDYGDGEWSDEEFATVFQTRKPEQVVSSD